MSNTTAPKGCASLTSTCVTLAWGGPSWAQATTSLHGFRVALQVRLDGPVAAVADPARDPGATGLAGHRPAEADALDQAVHHHASCDHWTSVPCGPYDAVSTQ